MLHSFLSINTKNNNLPVPSLVLTANEGMPLDPGALCVFP